MTPWPVCTKLRESRENAWFRDMTFSVGSSMSYDTRNKMHISVAFKTITADEPVCFCPSHTWHEHKPKLTKGQDLAGLEQAVYKKLLCQFCELAKGSQYHHYFNCKWSWNNFFDWMKIISNYFQKLSHCWSYCNKDHQTGTGSCLSNVCVFLDCWSDKTRHF